MIMATGTRISEGNRKVGTIPSVSLLPIVTCPKDAPCKSDCYVVRNMLRGPHGSTIRRAYNANTVLAKDEPLQYFAGIREYLSKRKPARFRWHVSGDITSYYYLQQMLAIAEDYPRVSFLAFTKRFDLLQMLVDECEYLPDNLTLRASQWYGRESSEELRSHFWSAYYSEERTWSAVDPHADYQSRADIAKPCSGHCENCDECWQRETDVVFHRH